MVTIKCLAVGTVLDNLYIVQDKDEAKTVLGYVSSPFGKRVRKILEAQGYLLGVGVYYWPRVSIRKVKDYRRVDQAKGIEVFKVGR